MKSSPLIALEFESDRKDNENQNKHKKKSFAVIYNLGSQKDFTKLSTITESCVQICFSSNIHFVGW